MEALSEDQDQIVNLQLAPEKPKHRVSLPVLVLQDIDKKVNHAIQNVIIVRQNA
jgi:hypothetical protein